MRRVYFSLFPYQMLLSVSRRRAVMLLLLLPFATVQAADLGTVSASIERGDYQQALNLSASLLAQQGEPTPPSSQRAELWRLQGVAHLYLEQRAEAYRAYQKALVLNALNEDSEADALAAVIRLAFRVNQYEEVLNYARQLSEQHHLQPSLGRLAMQAAYSLSRFDVAIDYARQLQELNALDAFALQTKALSEMALSRYSAAAATFDQLTRETDLAPKWVEQAARAHAKAGSHSSARQYLARAKADITLYRAMAASLLDNNDAKQALLYWQQGLQQLGRVATRDEQLFMVQCLIKMISVWRPLIELVKSI
ncbi:hypothetical protein [Salinivibrio socompensis]|uniref:hypothetical protein n=1 Tax=Salinivibrio socompensis TaxID=1510206 RepID=UPI000FE13D7B|nr:hypothetical protein [Salinivibrio socompensis]